MDLLAYNRHMQTEHKTHAQKQTLSAMKCTVKLTTRSKLIQTVKSHVKCKNGERLQGGKLVIIRILQCDKDNSSIPLRNALT